MKEITTEKDIIEDENEKNSIAGNTDILPDNVSALRYMMSNAGQIEYNPLEGYETAKNTENACVIFEGDWGGQIYLTCPMQYVNCTEEDLRNLLVYIERDQWDQGDGYNMFYEVIPVGHDVAGGMGGGEIIEGLWIHDEISDPKIRKHIYDTVYNAKTVKSGLEESPNPPSTSNGEIITKAVVSEKNNFDLNSRRRTGVIYNKVLNAPINKLLLKSKRYKEAVAASPFLAFPVSLLVKGYLFIKKRVKMREGFRPINISAEDISSSIRTDTVSSKENADIVPSRVSAEMAQSSDSADIIPSKETADIVPSKVYIPKSHKKYNLLPNNTEVFVYDSFLAEKAGVYPYGYYSYADFDKELDQRIELYGNTNYVLNELGIILCVYKYSTRNMNIKENWSVLRYNGKTTDQLTHGRYYYWPCSVEHPVYGGVIDDEQFTSYGITHGLEGAEWEIVEDPTGMAANTLSVKVRGSLKMANVYPDAEDLRKEIIPDRYQINSTDVEAWLKDAFGLNAKKLEVAICYYLRNETQKALELAFRCARMDSDRPLMITAFMTLFLFKNNDEIEQFFVDWIVNDDDPHSILREIAYSYWNDVIPPLSGFR